jgi:hypothetical protein
MLEEKHSRERQRLAWVVLLGSFAICSIIAVAVPLGANAALQTATESLNTLVQANEGTVGIDDETGGRQAFLAGEAGKLIEPGETVLTGNTATALVTITPPDNDQLLVRFQVYSNTDVHLLRADTPRFQVSNHERRILMKMDNGRIRITVPTFGERPSVIDVTTPQGLVTIQDPGQYSVNVTNEETQVTVQGGVASVTAHDFDDALILTAEQRAEVPTGSTPIGPLPTERNLITNGDFSAGKGQWAELPWTIERADQPAGRVRHLTEGGVPRLNFFRQGIGHADVSIRQSINQDVSELESLRLLLTFRILGHDLGVCGQRGSECPLFVRLNYVDEGGFSNTWQHGFYAIGETVPDVTPDVCIDCAMVQDVHERVPSLGQDFFYEVDVREELARQGRQPPRLIESILLVASGHSFEVEIVDIALMVDE